MTHRDMFVTELEEDHQTALIDHVIPSTLLNAAVALNDIIYTSCERMECKEHDVYGFDNLSLKNSLDVTEEKDHTVYSNDHSSRNETKVSSPDTRTDNYSSVDKTTSNHEDYLISLQQKRKESWESNTVEPIYRERKPLYKSSPSTLAHSCCSHNQNQVASREIRKPVVSTKILSSDQLRTEHKKQREIKGKNSQRKYDKQIKAEDMPREKKSDSKQTQSVVPDLGNGDIELKDSQLVTTKRTECSDTSKRKKTSISQSHPNRVSQCSETIRPSGNSIRHFKRTLSKYIRPVKFENASRPFLSPNRDMKDSMNERIHSDRSCRTLVADQEETAKKEYNYSGRKSTFRLKFLDRNESTIETENSGRSSRSAIFDQPAPVIMKRDHFSTRSYRTSKFNLNNITEENNCSRLNHRSVSLDQEEPTNKKVEEKELSGRSFRTVFLSRGRDKSKGISRHKLHDSRGNQHKQSKFRSKSNMDSILNNRTSLMSRFRGRSPLRRKTRDKKTSLVKRGAKKMYPKEELQINDTPIPSVGSNLSDGDKENGNIRKPESIQSSRNNGTFTRKDTETKAETNIHKILEEISDHHRRPKKDGRAFFSSSKFARNENNTENVNFIEGTLKHTITESSSSTDESLSHVFLAPNKEGQEIALPDGDYYYDDPAQVHSLLTMPSFGTLAPTIDAINRMDETRYQKELIPHERH